MTTLRPLLLDTRDGEWGKPEPADGRVKMRVIRGTDFESVRVGQVENVPTRFLEERHAERKRLQPWDIVFETAGGSPQKPTGRSLLLTPRTFELLGPDVTCASFARFLRVDPRQADPAFVFWMLQHHYETRDLLQFHTQHTGVARFQFTVFSKTFEFSLPPLETQQRIAAILGAYDDLIEVNRRRVAVLEEMARGLFEEWFVRFRFPGHEDVPIVDTPDGPLPEGWKWGTVSDIAEKTGANHNPSSTPDETFAHFSLPAFDAGHYPALDQGEDIKSNKTEFSSPAVLVSKLNPRIPRVWHVRVDYPQRQLASTEFVPLAPVGACSSSLLWVMVSDASFRDRLVRMAGGTSTSHQRVKPKDILATPIPLAPSKTFEQANEHVEPLVELSLNLEAANRSLAASRDLLLPRLISGQLSVEAAERELEDAA